MRSQGETMTGKMYGTPIVTAEEARWRGLVDIPAGVTSWRIKARGYVAYLYLKYPNRIEKRLLFPRGTDEMVPGYGGEWNRKGIGGNSETENRADNAPQ